MDNVNYEEIVEVIKRYDKEFSFEEFTDIIDDQNMVEGIDSYFKNKYEQYAVLGIDIYKYSGFPEPKQSLIPILFKLIYNETVKNCKKLEPFLFQKINDVDFAKKFISTGDGGFLLMPTPLHALWFIVYFEANLRTFNSFSFFPKLRHWIGEINLRYCLTLDNLFSFNDNFYGSAIITNSRLLSRDSLNRFLVDKNTYDWFLKTIGGIETLMMIGMEHIDQLKEFKDYDKQERSPNRSVILRTGSKTLNLINVQKIGLVTTKNQQIDVYNVFLQVLLHAFDDSNDQKTKPLVISIGNTNTSGINL